MTEDEWIKQGQWCIDLAVEKFCFRSLWNCALKENFSGFYISDQFKSILSTFSPNNIGFYRRGRTAKQKIPVDSPVNIEEGQIPLTVEQYNLHTAELTKQKLKTIVKKVTKKDVLKARGIIEEC